VDMSQARSSRQGHLMRVFLEGGVMSSRRWLIRRLPPSRRDGPWQPEVWGEIVNVPGAFRGQT